MKRYVVQNEVGLRVKLVTSGSFVRFLSLIVAFSAVAAGLAVAPRSAEAATGSGTLQVKVDGTNDGIIGVVTTENGVGLEGVKVDLFEAETKWVRGAFMSATHTDTDGGFGFLTATGCYITVAIAPDGLVFENGTKWRQTHVCVERVGDPPPVLVATLSAGQGAIEGTVIDRDGDRPVDGVKADLFEAENRWTRGAFLGSTRTGQDGRFIFSDLKARCYIVVVIADKGASFENKSRWHQQHICVKDDPDPDPQPIPEIEDLVERTTPKVVDLDPLGENAPPGTVEFVGNDVGLDGLRVEIESSGGISAFDVEVHPDRAQSALLGQVGASPVFDITVSRPESMTSAVITLPYDESRLNGAAEEDLHIATFDEESQLWVPVESPSTVDTEANTVSINVDDFSRYAVVGRVNNPSGDRFFWSAEAIEELFGNSPVRCVSGGDAASFDVVFAVDNSGSMLENDPSNLRVAAAQSFLDRMAGRDRAAVVSFSDPAELRLGLTSLITGRGTVEQALDGKIETDPFVLTDISGALDLSIGMLEGSSSDERVKVILLLTDGNHNSVGNPDFDLSLIGRAANRGAAIYTVALGAGADRSLLDQIAAGTGGRALAAADADELADIYDELADDLIDDGTDGDGDGLTDCEERNGLFSPWVFLNPHTDEIVPSRDTAVISITDPTLVDSDGDGTDDGVEVQRRNFADNPLVARTYQILIDQGRTSYFRLITGRPDLSDTDGDGLPDPVFPALRENCVGQASGPSPFDWDSDLDGVNDFIECSNGTDPLEFDAAGAFGVPGIRQSTLFSPEEYDGFGFAIPPVARAWLPDAGGAVRAIVMDNNPVYYDSDFNCVDNCGAITQWAADVPDDNGIGVCLFGRGDCQTDASQIRDKIKEIVSAQNVFTEDGRIRSDHIGFESHTFCTTRWEAASCDLGDMLSLAAGLNNGDGLRLNELERGKANVVGSQTRGATASDTWTTLVAAALIDGGYKVYRDAQQSREEREEKAKRLVKTCLESRVLEVLPTRGNLHPCEFLSIFAPSITDAGEAAVVVHDHIFGRTLGHMALNYQPSPEAGSRVIGDLVARGLNADGPRTWYNQFPPCNDRGGDNAGLDCQEYPYYSTSQSGPGQGIANQSPRASIRLVDPIGNGVEGVAFGSFTSTCPAVQARQTFIVTPLIEPGSPPTDYVCQR